MTATHLISRAKRRLDSRIVLSVAKRISSKVKRAVANPFAAQDATFNHLISRAKNTRFGREHDFHSISHYKDFKRHVPLRDYEALKPYINAIIAGESDVLWPGRPIFFAQTSGTASGNKYIPITTDFLQPYRTSAINAMCVYIAETGDAASVMGKLFYFAQNIETDRFNGVSVRPISGIAQAHTPRLFRKRFLPSDKANSINDFEKKIDISVEETVHEDVTLISGIPAWVQFYCNKLIERTGKPIKDIFPRFSLLVHGGVSIEPYRANLYNSIGKKVNTTELYPASEGFIGFQGSRKEPGLLLNLSTDIFYEFVPADEIFSASPTRVCLRDVETGVNYAAILNTSAGLWGYVLGDVIKFISKNPYRFIVAGRTAELISTAGEHLIAEDVESALADILKETGVRVIEFTVAPHSHPESGLPYHEWFIEFEKRPAKPAWFATRLNRLIGERNFNYRLLFEGKVILPLKIMMVSKGTFAQYMKSIGKLGGQNKVPRLSNDRKIADAMMKYVVPSPGSGD